MNRPQGIVIGQRVVNTDGVRVPYIPAGSVGEVTRLVGEEAWVVFPDNKSIRVPCYSLKPYHDS
jgi:hypothetical protein